MARKTTPAAVRNDGPAPAEELRPGGGGEPLFTFKELLVYVALCSVYAAILFSLDPEWVGWAGPLALGGALCATDPPPGPPVLSSPDEAFATASIFSVLSFVCLLLAGRSVATRTMARTSFTFLEGLRRAGSKFARSNRRANADVWSARDLAAGEGDSTTLFPDREAVSRDPGRPNRGQLEAAHGGSAGEQNCSLPAT